MRVSMPAELHLATTWGVIRIAAREGRIVSCDLPLLRQTPRMTFRVRNTRLAAKSAVDRRGLRKAEVFVRRLLAGRQGARPPLDWGNAPSFRAAVWRAMMRIPAGGTRSYAQLARMARRPRAARAAGQACAQNPLPLFVPCHRVLGSGSLGGFSSGLAWKRLLLEREAGACRDGVMRA